MSQSNSASTPAVAADRATEFVATTGGEESSSAEGLLVAAYLIMWLLVLLFVWTTWKRQTKLDARVQELEKALQGYAEEGLEPKA